MRAGASSVGRIALLDREGKMKKKPIATVYVIMRDGQHLTANGLWTHFFAHAKFYGSYEHAAAYVPDGCTVEVFHVTQGQPGACA